MAIVEKMPSVADEESSQPEPETWQPDIERLSESAETVEAGAHNEVLKSRAKGVDRLLNERLPKDLIDAVDGRAGERALSAESSEPDGTFLDDYVRNKGRGNEFNRLIIDLREGRTLKEIVGEVEQEMDQSIAKGERHDEKLRGVQAFSQLLREVSESREETLGAAEIETAKQYMRVSELLKAGVIRQELRDENRVKDHEEKDPGYTEQRIGFLERLQQTDDIPKDVKDRLSEAVQEVRANYVDDLSKEKPSLDSISYDASSPEVTSVEDVYGEGVEVEPPKPELKSREAVFGREGISREDLRGIAGEVQKLLEQDTCEGAFAAARQLGNLKRAGINLSDKRKSAIFERLNKHREAMGEVDPAEQARYLMYLKYLGVVDEITDEEKKNIEMGIVARTSRNDLADLDRLCVNAKYLGVRENFDDIQLYLEKDYEQKLARFDGEAEVTFARARRKYIGVDHELPEEYLQIEDRVDRRLISYKDEEQWGRYGRLRWAVDYVRGRAPVPKAAQEGMVRGVKAARARAQESGNWQAYTRYAADAATLSRGSEGVTGEPEQLVLDAYEEQPRVADRKEFEAQTKKKYKKKYKKKLKKEIKKKGEAA